MAVTMVLWREADRMILATGMKNFSFFFYAAVDACLRGKGGEF